MIEHNQLWSVLSADILCSRVFLLWQSLWIVILVYMFLYFYDVVLSKVNNSLSNFVGSLSELNTYYYVFALCL